MTTVTQNVGAMNFDNVDISDFELRGNITAYDSTHFRINYLAGDYDDFYGTGFVYTNGKPTGGVVNGYTVTQANATTVSISNMQASGVTLTISQLLNYVAAGDTASFIKQVLAGNDTINGTNLADIMRGQGGDDTLTGGGGADSIDGGAGRDTVVYSGLSSQYTVTLGADGSLKVVDNRANSPDGTDTLYSIEALRFSDATVTPPTVPATQATVTAFSNIMHQSGASSIAADLSAKVAAGTITQAQAVTQIIKLAADTTSVATLAYQFFTGATPTAAGYDYLVSPAGPNGNNLNSAYYQAFNIENRYINFAVNLGASGEGKAGFQAAYGSLSLFDATKKAYATIFGSTPTDAKVHAMIDDRADYFAYYGRDGANGVGTKAAMVGWLLAEAVKADVGTYAKANDAFLTDLADGAVYNVSLIGAYGSADYAYAA